MQKRRMVSRDVISEGRFLRMSLTAQALYMHLLANADDDGCVDAYSVTRMIGAKEDDLVLLKEREYIVVLDEKEYILWIAGWQDFNWVDARYKEDSRWLPLLRSKVQGLEIVESTSKEYNRARHAARKAGKSALPEESAHAHPTGGPSDAHELHAGGTCISKVKLSKVKSSPLSPPSGEKPGKYAAVWEEEVGAKLRSRFQENERAGSVLEGMLGSEESLRKLARTVRAIRADRYAGKDLHVVGNWVKLLERLEAVEAYAQGLEERQSFSRAESASRIIKAY